MDDEPSNAATRANAEISALDLNGGSPDEVLAEVLSRVSEDFIQYDRRKLLGSTSAIGKAEYAKVAAFFLFEAGLESREQKILAVRGEHLFLARISDRYRDGSTREFLGVAHFTGDPMQERLAVMFDDDDLDAAMAELDRLAAQLNS